MSKEELSKWARYFDHTQLRPQATLSMINDFCNEALEKGFYSLCVNPHWVPHCTERLKDSPVELCTVIGFPLGATTTASKSTETKEAVANGASEIDMVLNIGAVLDGRWDFVKQEISEIVKAAASKPVKVILETCFLSRAEITSCCKVSVEAGASFVKTSTGFGPRGANVEDVKLMRECVGQEIGVKASGGIKTMEDFFAMIDAGASRIGSSSSYMIIEDIARAE